MKIHDSNSSSVMSAHSFEKQSGFSLLELLTAMAIFMVIGGAGITLFKEHVPLFTAQQSQTAVNISARNAAAQIQMDLVNAGTGFYLGANVPSLPIGMSVLPGTTFGACNPGTTQNYTAACYDTMSIITIDATACPLNATGEIVGGANGLNTLTGTLPAGSSCTSGATAAAQYKAGDEVLFVMGGVDNPGSKMAVAVLTANATASGNTVTFTHNKAATYTDVITGQTYTDDYYNLNYTLSNNGGNATQNTSSDRNGNNSYGVIGIQPVVPAYAFGPNDWIIKIRGTTYGVSLANPADPTLVRSADNGPPQFVADQIIGFRIGAYAYDDVAYAQPPNPQTAGWYYDGSTYDMNTVQAVRVSLIGRTNPVGGQQAHYTNTFDGGTYQVQGVSIVVNPRNLSMNN